MKSVRFLVVCLTGALLAASPTGAQTYQDGTWRDTERLTKVTGSMSHVVGNTVMTDTTRSVKQQYIIETADLMIVATLVRQT